MPTVAVANSDAALSGATLLTAGAVASITALHTFSRSPSAPFAVTAGSAVVPNLDADKLDGLEASAFLQSGLTALTVGDGAAEDTKIVFDGNAQDYYLGLDDSADDLVCGLGSAVGTTPGWSLDENQDMRIWQDLQIDGPTVTLGDGTAEDVQLVFNGNAQDFFVGLDDSGDDLAIGTGSTVAGGTNALLIEADPRVTISTALRFNAVISPAQLTANQNDYAPAGLSTAIIVRLSSDASRTITGLSATVGGHFLILCNVGSNDIVLANQDAGSAAANRFAIAQARTLSADECVIVFRDGTSSRWRIADLPNV